MATATRNKTPARATSARPAATAGASAVRAESPATNCVPSLREYEDRLRVAGQFVTVQRRAILRYLVRHLEHPTTAQIARAVGRAGSASLATVYNNLALFQELSIVQMVRDPDGEMHWDLRTGHHHHLTCEGCGQVSDIDGSAAEVVVRDANLRQRVARSEVWLVGRCERCG
jgi:Fur family ferric uptake transcriptional regulator